jgi:DNA polymerase IV
MQEDLGRRKIIHVDMDCFYASVEIKHQPELAGRAIGVGGPANSRGVLCTANYEARKFGVRSAMPSSQATRLCPHLIILPPNFALYKKESLAVREILSSFSNVIEPLSLDEAYIDVTDSPHFAGSATLIARAIRERIHKELRLTASAGVAPNKFLAKIASDWRKPNGQFVIRPTDIPSFMPELPVEKIYGVGKVTAQRMHELGLKTCGDIQKQSPEQLCRWLGSRGEDLARLAFGYDHRPVEPHSERKSLTVEETFDKDFHRLDSCLEAMPELYRDWERRMEKSGVRDRIRGWVVKAKFFDFKGTTHESAARSYPHLRDFQNLFKNIWTRRSDPVRLIGLGVRLAEPEEIPYQLKLAL